MWRWTDLLWSVCGPDPRCPVGTDWSQSLVPVPVCFSQPRRLCTGLGSKSWLQIKSLIGSSQMIYCCLSYSRSSDLTMRSRCFFESPWLGDRWVTVEGFWILSIEMWFQYGVLRLNLKVWSKRSYPGSVAPGSGFPGCSLDWSFFRDGLDHREQREILT